MSAKFSKGPWSVGRKVPWIVTANDIIVCECDSRDEMDRDEEIANAHLIAAAPRMYEALEAIVMSLDRRLASPTEILDENSPIMDEIRDCIKAVRGEPSKEAE